jgi:hypothetical protein
MKTRIILISILLICLSTVSFTQPDYSFKNPILESGTNLAVNAIYRFKTVKPGTDALVKILSTSGNITLSSIDENWTGYDEAFQPFIDVPALSDGYVEFEISFVTPNGKNPKNQTEVAMTCVDIDGLGFNNGNIYEQDQLELINGYYDFAGSSPELITYLNAPLSGSQWVCGSNLTGYAIDGIDTIDRNIMYSVVNSNINKVKVRIGARNTSPTKSDVRYRSVYFKKFSYPSSFLSISSLQNFTATKQFGHTQLNWTMNNQTTNMAMQLEKSYNGSQWQTMSNYEMKDGTIKGNTTIFDQSNFETSKTYYRLKITGLNNTITYSNILVVQADESTSKFKVYPTAINNSTTVQVNSNANNTGVITVADLQGRVVFTQKTALNKGVNQIQVTGLENLLTKGQYVLSLASNDQKNSTWVYKQ